MRFGRRAGIGLAVVVCAVALGNARCARSSPTPRRNGHGNIVNGYQVFNNYFCVACHAMKAAGPAAYGQLGMNFNKINAPYRRRSRP